MPVSTTSVLDGVGKPYVAGGSSWYRRFFHGIRTSLIKFNIFAKYHSCMIGAVQCLDTGTQTAIITDLKTHRRLGIRYEKSSEAFLLDNINELLEIVGKIQIDRNANPLLISAVEKLSAVDTSDLQISQVLPNFLKLRSPKDPIVRVELDEHQQFYCARLPELKVFACGDTREQLKERLIERVEFCWDEFVREDDSDFNQNAKLLREKLLRTFEEVE